MNVKIDSLITELQELDNELVEIEGSKLKPSQCYHFERDPVHMLYNTNCPEALKQKIEVILSKYLSGYETGSHQ